MFRGDQRKLERAGRLLVSIHSQKLEFTGTQNCPTMGGASQVSLLPQLQRIWHQHQSWAPGAKKTVGYGLIRQTIGIPGPGLSYTDSRWIASGGEQV